MNPTIELGSFLQSLTQKLAGSREAPGLEAQVLVAQVLHKPRPWVLAHPEQELKTGEIHDLEAAASRLASGEPLPYILGHWEFFGLDFEVNPAVLIPRPETELLVEKALAWLAAHPGAHRIADIGTGSGCIAVTIAVHSPTSTVFACDQSYKALEVARRNANRHGTSKSVSFVQSDLLNGIRTKFDLVCANLPYIPERKLATLKVAAFEPSLALNGGENGLVLIHRLLKDASLFLAPRGFLLLEIEAEQGPEVLALASTPFPQAKIRLIKDLGGLDRLVSIQR